MQMSFFISVYTLTQVYIIKIFINFNFICSVASYDKLELRKYHQLQLFVRYVSHVSLAAAFSALDIGLSQWSFEYITISLYTMTKTTSIIFILIFAIFLKLEEKVSGLQLQLLEVVFQTFRLLRAAYYI